MDLIALTELVRGVKWATNTGVSEASPRCVVGGLLQVATARN